ncbi:DUF2804 family protein [Pseudoflavonifractor sp. BIOML-A6]|nr:MULTISPECIES: DUF2804 domain-containing protein [unclassified Pseudoflavonifractor]MTQ97858.1 DUF2804 family protein [Pseudoflavonifractor sp. BIOML-A16]MTR04544.1 DUF2804 family protein [Pseudoflavonifractor sp. BIOML-A15]MTR33556.1 DUF2804 family protein [Pseudoflavonifractor sp. BIOML-A14]MTR71773.1 DUF2804 family protein [Pseudoflavonifractor sp. BIOML-A18]MTS62684.1 DUF2804 family protein [Pseudoflavonifractor sp. BIOML-A5]MTS71722.1 DUF2804 family protein [Pseudoflavonifractor sp. BI
MQHEITRPIPLLDERGNLTEAGYAKRLLPVYDRARVRGGATRLKEWDYYLVMNDRFALALTIADNSYMGLDSISLLDFDEGWQVTRSPMRILPMGRTGLPAASDRGDVGVSGKGYGIFFRVSGEKRLLCAHMDKFQNGEALDVQIALTDAPEESMVICTPFHKPGHFYYNQKINCMRATGRVTLGERTYSFRPEHSFGTLDWGRGVWTYHNTWYWGSGSGLADGVPFGFNIGYGFGDTSAASENMLFYDGTAHKLSQVAFHIPRRGGRDDFMSPWTFTSDDGRFEMDFVPMLDRAACTSVGVIKSDQHQVFGRFTGRAVLDGGGVIELKDFMGFAEKVENKW